MNHSPPVRPSYEHALVGRAKRFLPCPLKSGNPISSVVFLLLCKLCGEGELPSSADRSVTGAGAAAVAGLFGGPGQSSSVDCNRHTLSGCGLLAIRLP
jgi:hypothetical protein